jgi:hypothetical protein
METHGSGKRGTGSSFLSSPLIFRTSVMMGLCFKTGSSIFKRVLFGSTFVPITCHAEYNMRFFEA